MHGVPVVRHVPMPTSRSFPSGHAASAFAFAGGVGRALPADGIPMHLLAGAVAYSRVHTGVHFPGDVMLGAVLGTVLAQVTTHQLERRRL
jgi:undecaprenyl-diphosphatase